MQYVHIQNLHEEESDSNPGPFLSLFTIHKERKSVVQAVPVLVRSHLDTKDDNRTLKTLAFSSITVFCYFTDGTNTFETAF